VKQLEMAEIMSPNQFGDSKTPNKSELWFNGKADRKIIFLSRFSSNPCDQLQQLSQNLQCIFLFAGADSFATNVHGSKNWQGQY